METRSGDCDATGVKNMLVAAVDLSPRTFHDVLCLVDKALAEGS